MINRIVVVALAMCAAAAPLSAQKAGPRPGGAGRGKAAAAEGAPQDRAQLERRFRENFAAEVKKRLQLTDDQMTKLTAVNQRLDAQRRQLFQEERDARMALRTELANPDDKVNQARVAELLDNVVRLQRTRLDLVEREQRELSAFLTPVQRARYQAFVDFVQRRMDDLDGRRGGPGQPGQRGEPGRGGPPGGGARGGRPPVQTPPPSR